MSRTYRANTARLAKPWMRNRGDSPYRKIDTERMFMDGMFPVFKFGKFVPESNYLKSRFGDVIEPAPLWLKNDKRNPYKWALCRSWTSLYARSMIAWSEQVWLLTLLKFDSTWQLNNFAEHCNRYDWIKPKKLKWVVQSARRKTRTSVRLAIVREDYDSIVEKPRYNHR
jgi:hypothetical protein